MFSVMICTLRVFKAQYITELDEIKNIIKIAVQNMFAVQNIHGFSPCIPNSQISPFYQSDLSSMTLILILIPRYGQDVPSSQYGIVTPHVIFLFMMYGITI